MSSALNWMPLAAVVALVTTGCAREGFYDDRAVDYAEAEQSAPLVLPEARNAGRYRDALPVPEAAGAFHAQAEGFEAPPPQALGAGRSVEAGRVERREIAGDRWLVVGAEPSTVWSELERFVAVRGLTVTARDSARGVLETPQGRLSVRPGLRAGNSEVRCDQGGAPAARCLQALESDLKARSASASAASLAAQRPELRSRPRLEQQGGEWQVVLPFAIDRTWAELRYQLEADFAVAGRRELLAEDAQAHTFLVDYLTASERTRGLWTSLATLELGETPQRIRLELRSTAPEMTVLQARSADERPLAEDDRRELLERVAGLLR